MVIYNESQKNGESAKPNLNYQAQDLNAVNDEPVENLNYQAAEGQNVAADSENTLENLNYQTQPAEENHQYKWVDSYCPHRQLFHRL